MLFTRLTFAALLALSCTMASAADFSGDWDASEYDSVLSATTRTTITLIQNGNRLCGTWSYLNYRKYLVSASLVGIVKGDVIQLKDTGLLSRFDDPSVAEEGPGNMEFKLVGNFLLDYGESVGYGKDIALKRQGVDASRQLDCKFDPSFRGWPAAKRRPVPRSRGKGD